MKTKIILFLLCFNGTFLVNAQSGPYSRIYFEANASQMEILASAGVALDHLVYDNLGYVGEFSSEETSLIKTHAKHVKIIISDLTAHFINSTSSAKASRAGLIHTQPLGFDYGSMGGYLTYEEADSHVQVMIQKYPNLISKKDSIGLSLLGNTIYAFKVSDNPNTDEDEPEVLYTALHHAREPISMMQMLYYVYFLLENYNSDSIVANIVNNTEMYFIPFVNPDGYLYNQSTNPNGGGMWRKNRRLNSDSSYGVDLNRNYGYLWGLNNIGSSGIPNSSIYRGNSAFSEPETKVIRDFCLQRQFKITLNYHAFGEYLIYPWGDDLAESTTPDYSTFYFIANKLSLENGYKPGTCNQTLKYRVNGNSDDWMYGEQTQKSKILAYTPEVGNQTDGFWPIKDRIITLCDMNITQNLEMAKLGMNMNVTNLNQNVRTSFTLYPNPSTGKIYLHSKNNSELYIRIFNSLGALVYVSMTANDSEIDLSKLPIGIYHCTVSQNNVILSHQSLLLVGN